jgi:hypothetical protein
MATLQRVRVTWSGFPGGPGVSTFYFSTLTTAYLTALRTFYNALVAMLPNTCSIQVAGSGDTISDVDGKINGVWSNTPPSVVTGTSASGYAAPVGVLVRWESAGIVNGHHVRGKTYIVPAVNIYEANGTIVAANLTTISGAAATLLTAVGSDMKVWARPFDTDPVDPAKHRDGSSYAITSATVPDKAVVLRSRRD